MARGNKSEQIQTEPKETSGTARIAGGDGGLRIADPVLEKKAVEKPIKAATKQPDPHKPKDVNIGSAHIIKMLAGNIADNRMTRLKEKSRNDNDTAWLLAEYLKLSETKKS